MYKFARDPQTGDYAITNSETGETKTYTTQAEFNTACLVIMLQAGERLEAGLDRMIAIERRGDRPCTLPPPPAEMIAHPFVDPIAPQRDTVRTGEVTP